MGFGRQARWVVTAAALIGGGPAMAQTVSVSFDIDPQRAMQLGLDPDDAEWALNELIDEALKLGTLGDFMNSMANAAAISTKGMGVDYANSFGKVIGGVSVGSGSHGVGLAFARGRNELPSGGFAAQVSGMVGINLGGMTLAKKGAFSHRISLYANGMGMPLPSGGPFGGFMYNAGGHLQVKLIMPVDAKVAEWGGIALTSGFQRSSYSLTMRRDLPLETHIQGVDVGWTASGDYRISATNDAIPIELSTSFRVLVVSAYVGGGVDLNTGSSDASGSMSGPVEGRVGSEREALGQASVSLAASGLADAMVPRIFVGAQANVMMVKVYGHLNVGMNESVGGHVGARVGF